MKYTPTGRLEISIFIIPSLARRGGKPERFDGAVFSPKILKISTDTPHFDKLSASPNPLLIANHVV
jgi:hypothetical protein